MSTVANRITIKRLHPHFVAEVIGMGLLGRPGSLTRDQEKTFIAEAMEAVSIGTRAEAQFATLPEGNSNAH